MKLLAVAGEPSGDAHGGPLLSGLKRLIPALDVEGIGGPLMQNAGLRSLYPFSELQVHGIVEILHHLPRLYAMLWGLEKRLDAARPDALLLIDYPGFNLKLASSAKKRGIPVIFYSSPQVWAWRKRRLSTIARAVDLMIVLFPFEAAIYRDIGVDVAFAGHPLVGVEASAEETARLRKRVTLDPSRPVVAVIPGSRPSEIERNLPAILAGIELIRDTGFEANFLMPLAPNLDQHRVESLVEASGAPVQVVRDAFLPLLKLADIAIAASGTATLQLGLAGVPFVVVYRMSRLTYLLAKKFAYVRHISIVNILAGKEIVPELLQSDFAAESVRDTFLQIANDPDRRNAINGDLQAIAKSLGEPGAYGRTAELIATRLENWSRRTAAATADRVPARTFA